MMTRDKLVGGERLTVRVPRQQPHRALTRRYPCATATMREQRAHWSLS